MGISKVKNTTNYIKNIKKMRLVIFLLWTMFVVTLLLYKRVRYYDDRDQLYKNISEKEAMECLFWKMLFLTRSFWRLGKRREDVVSAAGPLTDTVIRDAISS